MSRYGETCVLNRHRCPYAHQNNHYTRSRSRSRSRSRGRRRERSRSRGRYNSNIYGHHRRKRKPAQESVIDRHRKELEEISATGAIELWGLSPREPPPDCDDEPTKMALPADRMKRTRESESESEEDSSEEKKKKKKHKKCSKKKLRKSHYKKKSKKHHKKKVHQMSSSESDDESDEEDTDMESQESWIEKQKDKDKEGGDGVIGPLPLMQDAGNQDITERHVITNSATPVCCNKGKDNFARLCCAFIEVGTLVLTKISEKVCSQKKLDSRLKDDTILKELTSLRKEKVLSGSQWIKLYPLRRSSSVSFRDFDPPLQLLLLRSIFGLNFTASGQDSFPPATDISPVAGLTCLKVLRDRIHRHDAIGSVDDPTFNSYWSDMKIIFVRFGGRCCLDTIRYLEVYCLEEDLGEEYRKQLREWMRDDVSTEDKLGEEPKHGGAAENAKIGPPELSIHISKISELPKDFSGWESGRLPVDILLFTVEEVEFLSCYVFLKNPIKSYHMDIGVVYFSSMEDKQGHKVKIALMRCSKVHDGPGGALSAAKDAILLLRPKALFSVGTCRGIESTTIKPGDVIVSSKVITLDFKIPPRRHCLKLLGHLAAGWTPPLRNANEYEVKVHPGALISIPKVNEDIIRQYSEAIGLDKDGGGISTAANDLGTEWLIVKGIEDFKNDSQSSNNKWKEFASLMAASLVAKLLSDPFIFQDWPRLNAPSAFR